MDRQVQPRPPARRSRDHLPDRRDRRHHRPRRAPRSRRWCRWPWSSPPSSCSGCGAAGDERRAVAIPLAVGATAIARPAPAGAGTWRQGLRPRPQPAAGPGAAAPRASPSPSASAARARLGTAIAALLLAYSLGFCIWVERLARPAAAGLEGGRRPPRRARRAAGDGDLGDRRGAPALLPRDGATEKPSEGAIQLKASEGYDWLVREVDVVSLGEVAAPAHRACSVRACAKPPTNGSASCTSAATGWTGRGWCRCACGACATPRRTSGTTGCSWTG